MLDPLRKQKKVSVAELCKLGLGEDGLSHSAYHIGRCSPVGVGFCSKCNGKVLESFKQRSNAARL